jgi:hypothetical protein
MRSNRIKNKIVIRNAEIQNLLRKIITVVWPSRMNRQKTDTGTDMQTETYRIETYRKAQNIQPGTGKHQNQRKEMARKENKRLGKTEKAGQLPGL